MLLVFEGIDGCGKSKQVKLLANLITNSTKRKVKIFSTSDNRPMRTLYRSLISEEITFPTPLESVFLSLSDFAYMTKKIDNELANGQIILAHRYIYSAFADALALGVDLKYIRGLISLFPEPYLTLFIHTSSDYAFSRKEQVSLAEAGGPDFIRKHRNIKSAFIDYQNCVNNSYQMLINNGLMGKKLIEIDGNQSIDIVHQIVKRETYFLHQQP